MDTIQFDALARLLRLREGPPREAAKLILVGNVSLCQAAQLSDCSVQRANNTHKRCLNGLRSIREIVGYEDDNYEDDN